MVGSRQTRKFSEYNKLKRMYVMFFLIPSRYTYIIFLSYNDVLNSNFTILHNLTIIYLQPCMIKLIGKKIGMGHLVLCTYLIFTK